jgi:hypothetical protein
MGGFFVFKNMKNKVGINNLVLQTTTPSGAANLNKTEYYLS